MRYLGKITDPKDLITKEKGEQIASETITTEISSGGRIHNVPSGGTSGQALMKNSATDYDLKWGNVDALPSQEGQSGKFLTTNGTTASWGTVDLSSKADKVSGATSGNFAGLDVNGNLTDSTKKASDFATAAQGATAESAYGLAESATGKAELAIAKAEDVADTALPKSWVNDTVTSTSTTYALSANQGKVLNDRINNLSPIGRFLSVWNCTTGKPTTDPSPAPTPESPYAYRTGDYYIVGTVGTTNYKPNGSSYTGAASTTTETGTVSVNDTYYYDNNTWTLLHTVVPTVSFSSLAGDPYDNANMTTALNDKAASDHTHNYVNIQTLPSGADLNDYTTSSIWYNVSTATISTFLHKPDGAPSGECMLEIRELGSSRYVYQQYTAKGGSDYQNYGRVYNNGAWGLWKKVAWTAEIPNVSGKEDTANKVTSDIGISSSSTDTQYPSAKAVYNAIQGSITDSIGGSY